MTFKPTPAHNAIRSALLEGADNLLLAAVAGSGKTSTILWLMEQLREAGQLPKTLYTSFARRNIDDVKPRLPTGVSAETMHALGLRAIKAAVRGRPRVDGGKGRKLLHEVLRDAQERRLLGGVVLKLVGAATSQGLVPSSVDGERLVDDSPEAWEALCERFGVDAPEGDEVYLRGAIEAARTLLALKLRDLASIDFDDMLLAPVVFGFPAQRYDLIFIDEAQDLSPVQQAFLRALVGPEGRVVIVGDEHQAIYGFRGADTDSLGTLAAEWRARRFPLARSYRCPQAVGPLVAPIVPHFEVHEGNPEGLVEHRGDAAMALPHMAPADMVLCRNNAPLVKLAYAALAQRIPVRVLGRDIGAGLLALVKRLRPSNVGDLLARLDAYEAQEVGKLTAGEQSSAKIQAVQDRCACLRVIATSVDDLDQLEADVSSLFVDDDEKAGRLTLSSCHKAKGLEAERVWILDRDLLGNTKRAKTEEQARQEHNLAYVAYTRTRHDLFFVETKAKAKAAD